MATVKVTFTLDSATLARLQDAASTLALPKNEVIRKAIWELHDRIGRLSERERIRLLQTFDDVMPRIPTRTLANVQRELKSLRQARHRGRRSNTQR